jgi:3',5'-cyclic AMP phosphodiesterase CpdA
MRLAITADLHWGHRRGEEATVLLRDFLADRPPDVFLIAGDVGTGPCFGECLGLFADLPCPKALVPGNHDVWVEDDDPRGDSLQVYHEHLPLVCAEYGFHYLDRGPLLLPETGLAVAGTINWYDYSWSLDRLRGAAPDWEERLRTKTFRRGRYNDARFIRWPLDDGRFTAEVVATFERQLDEVLGRFKHVLVVTHHPAFAGISFPSAGPPSLDGLLWAAFAGNTALEAVLARRATHVPFAFSGHTHRARENHLGTIRGYNIGGDYHFKRLLVLDWPGGIVQAHTFGNPTDESPW